MVANTLLGEVLSGVGAIGIRELRPKIEGQPYPSLRAKQLTVEHHLRQLAAHREQVKRLTNWD